MTEVILAYVPVLHQGYLSFFTRHPAAQTLYLIGEEFTQEIETLQKDIRALPATEMALAIAALHLFEKVEVVQSVDLAELAKKDVFWILPDEELMHQLAERNLTANLFSFDSVFLRWDRKSILAEKPVVSAKSILPDEFQKVFSVRARALKEKSADWWRQVGGVLVKDGRILAEAWNRHLPSTQEPYFNGDPRASFHRGEQIELGTAIHSEASLIAQSAKKGESTEGSDLYTTTFPCPVCAKLISAAGIKRVYFSEGYAMLDGESLLQANGVEIFKVE